MAPKGAVGFWPIESNALPSKYNPTGLFPAKCNARSWHSGIVTWGCNVIQGNYDPPGFFTAECNAGMWLFQVWLVSIPVDPQWSVIQLEKSTPDSLPELKCFRADIFVTCPAVWSAHILQQTDWGGLSVNIFILQWYNISNSVCNTSQMLHWINWQVG